MAQRDRQILMLKKAIEEKLHQIAYLKYQKSEQLKSLLAKLGKWCR